MSELSSSSLSKLKAKHFVINYDPDANRRNIYARKLDRPLPGTRDQFAANPFTKLLQPTDVTKSKRFVRDKLNISDIPGVKPDVYKNHIHLEGRQYLEVSDIDGARPSPMK